MSEAILNSRQAKQLFIAVSKLKTPGEAKNFLRDLCTLAELKAMSERLEVAKLIEKDESYRSISKKTGSSTATVTRVAQWLHHGRGGYKLILGRIAR